MVITWPSQRPCCHQDAAWYLLSMMSPSLCSFLLFYTYLFICLVILYIPGTGFLSLCTADTQELHLQLLHTPAASTKQRYPLLGCIPAAPCVQHLHTGGDLVRGHKASLGNLHLCPAGTIVHSLFSAWPMDMMKSCTKHSPSEIRGSSWLGSGN